LLTPFESLDDILVWIEDGKIASIEHVSVRHECACGYPHRPDVPAQAIDGADDIIAPGFVDIHVHGAGGFDVMSATYETLDAMSTHLLRSGVTSFVPTTTTAPWEQIICAVEAVAQAKTKGATGAQVLGAHLEGPYVNPTQAGVIAAEHAREPSVDEFREKLGALSAVVGIVTLAPELPNARDLIRYLAARNITVSIGHSDATYEQAIDAIDAGASQAGHLFNANRPLNYRAPGVAGAVLADDRVRAEIVWDNVHLHPGAARLVVNAKRSERVALVSDSSVSLDAAVRNAAGFFPLNQAVMMATYVPAYAVGAQHEKGSIAVGKDADLVALDRELRLKWVLLRGQLVNG